MYSQESETKYTPGRTWEILVEGSEDVDELLDIQVGLTHLPPEQALFLVRLGQGFTGEQAMGEAGLSGNQTRLKRLALLALTKAINGEQDAS